MNEFELSRLSAQAQVAISINDVRSFFEARPDQWAELLRDEGFVQAMYFASGVKLDIQHQQIHAPGPTARKATGHGRTLCNNRGVRGDNVTCKHCLRILARRAA